MSNNTFDEIPDDLLLEYMSPRYLCIERSKMQDASSTSFPLTLYVCVGLLLVIMTIRARHVYRMLTKTNGNKLM